MDNALPAPEPTAPDLTTAQLVDEAGVAGDGVVDSAATELADVVKMPEATADATMVDVDAGGEYANIACSRAYTV